MPRSDLANNDGQRLDPIHSASRRTGTRRSRPSGRAARPAQAAARGRAAPSWRHRALHSPRRGGQRETQVRWGLPAASQHGAFLP
eukprot:CAMPEP_0202044540 /NCGR_PEP_ID=MMETSP0963-20130614/75_1 /ASSEMBLY_ACC=CAM_ASM_000494 /TAXON_ID=4773 /ORGANISM="Schizochytrium aggregatum, Strain ATCC28209" /LENGTH=84 /DNA_ID=CAMNT_0048609057 /DNA_START=207 /DNA_END=457 /DNA_ORIENTATION=+